MRGISLVHVVAVKEVARVKAGIRGFESYSVNEWKETPSPGYIGDQLGRWERHILGTDEKPEPNLSTRRESAALACGGGGIVTLKTSVYTGN